MRPARGDRLRILTLSLLTGFVVLLLRAAQLSVLEHEEHKGRADRQHKNTILLPSLRGPILDRGGEVLALSVSGSSLALDPYLATQPESLAAALDRAEIAPAERVLHLIRSNSDRRFVWLTRSTLPEGTVRRLEERFGQALIRMPESKRLYPLGRFAAPLIGATGTDGEGLLGIEGRFESELHGAPGKMLEFRSGSQKKHQGPGRILLSESKIGSTVELTIDARIQQILDSHLSAAVEQQNARGGGAILINPHTGEILAMASQPSFEPDRVREADSLALRNWSVTEIYEPGSTYKIVAYAAALEEGRLGFHDGIDCMGGRRRVPGGTVRDHDPYGTLATWEAFAKSSNIAAGLVAEMAGEESFYRMERLLGFGVLSGVEVPGEKRGWIPDPSGWSKRSLITQAFGQEISCTVLQLAMAYGVAANGGMLMRPYLVRSIRTSEGEEIHRQEPEIIRRAIRPETARILREMMRKVVVEGTAAKAEVEGVFPGGKTGTAQKFIKEIASYSNERYIASFVGFAPYDAPRWLCAVVIDEPRGSIWGGSVAAPVFAKILNDVAQLDERQTESPSRAIHWTPELAGPVAFVPAVEGLPRNLGRMILKQEGLIPKYVGRGEQVVDLFPPAGSRCAPGDVVQVILGGEPDSVVQSTLPSFMGLSLRDASARARWHDLSLEIRGSGWVVAQDPPAGTPVAEVPSLRLRLAADSCRAFVEWLAEER